MSEILNFTKLQIVVGSIQKWTYVAKRGVTDNQKVQHIKYLMYIMYISLENIDTLVMTFYIQSRFLLNEMVHPRPSKS